MLRSLYASMTGMMTMTRKMDVITNNLSNVNTYGYKKDYLQTISFKDMLLNVGPYSPGIHIDEVVTDFTPEALQETGNPMDIALQGEGFFVVQTPNGQERYTRGGSGFMDGQGYLTLKKGNRMMGVNGPIQINSSDVSIDKNGNITTDGNYIDTLRTVRCNDNKELRKTGDGLYQNTGGIIKDFPAEVVQGSLEASNVDVIKEMMDMMEVNRNYESNQRIIKMLDESLGKTVNDIARL